MTLWPLGLKLRQAYPSGKFLEDTPWIAHDWLASGNYIPSLSIGEPPKWVVVLPAVHKPQDMSTLHSPSLPFYIGW